MGGVVGELSHKVIESISDRSCGYYEAGYGCGW